MKGTILLVTFFITVSFCSAEPPCDAVPSGEIVLFPHESDCSKFYECEGIVKIERECDSGLWFNEALQSCDYPSTSGCVPVSTSTTASPAICASSVLDYFPYPFDCSLYFECYYGILSVHSCPGGLWFEPPLKRCIYAASSSCIMPSSSTYLPTFTTPDSVCIGVRPGETLLKSNPSGDCTKYIECYGAERTDMDCPSGLYFNYLRQLCDWPAASGCIPGVTPPPDSRLITENSILATPPTGTDDPRCVDGSTEYWPHPTECNKYIECYEGLGYEMECPRGLFFNATDKMCESSGGVPCGEATTPSGSTSTIDPDWTPHPDCSSDPDYLSPYPGDCTLFYECAGGYKYVQSCPDNLWFNPYLLICDYPYQAGCVWTRDA